MTLQLNPIKAQSKQSGTIYFVDLFCGAGGVTTGISMARNSTGQSPAKVVACVNHDKNAILSHKANHPDTEHFEEDIRDPKVIENIRLIVERVRRDDPRAEVHLWASLECTNFSKAKGGQPRDGDSRTLANFLPLYVQAFMPDQVWIENVREFMAWGAIDKNGKPVSRDAGRDYLRWVKKMKRTGGYVYDWRLLCCADYGDYTSRTRFFAQFRRPELGPIKWPERTHSKKPKTGGLFKTLLPHKPVREVLDLEDYGQSIFGRRENGKKPLVENSLKRIEAGLIKFVGKGQDSFISKAYSGSPKDKVCSLDNPAPTVTTIPHESIVRPVFMAAAYGGSTEQRVYGLDEPCRTVTVQQRLQAILIQYNGGAGLPKNAHCINKPAITLTTKDRLAKVQFMPMQYGQGGNIANIDEPAWAITTNPKHLLATVQYLVNPQFNSAGRDVDRPCFTLIAKMDKRPPQIASVQPGGDLDCIAKGMTEVPRIYVYQNPLEGAADRSAMYRILVFMLEHNIADIKMRMLNIEELKRITGLPTGYVLYGTQGDQKKFIGNAVPTYVVKAMVEAYC